MTQQYPPPAGSYGQPQYQQPPKRRKVWPWVLLGVVLVPILGFVACTAVLGAGVKAVGDARKGGTVAIGESFTYASGLAISVSQPKSYATQQIAVGQRLDIPFRFKVPDGTSGPLQIAVTDTFNEPVFFTGTL